LTTLRFRATLGPSPVSMSSFPQRVRLRMPLPLALLCVILLRPVMFAQDRASDEGALRGDHAEIAVTLRGDGGRIIVTPATVKLYRSGVLTGQAPTTNGRAFFILEKFGDYLITAEAAGYKSAQKDVLVTMAIKDEEDLVLHREAGDSGNAAMPGGELLLAPKAKEAFDKGLEALNQNKLEQAEKYIGEAMRLAPSHPDVLYLQGVIYLKRHQWGKAQDVLAKATQLDPKHGRALSALGMALVDDGKYDQALAPLRQSLELGPVSWETHWALAKAYYYTRQFEDALRESQEAASQSHGAAPQIELLVAQSLTAVGRYEDSAQTLRSFLKNHSNDPGAPTARMWLQRLAADGKIQRQ
jgi:tetratricopeptide (TPR) repeat protein